MIKYLAYDDYNSRIFADYEIGGSVMPNCNRNALRNGWKIIVNKIKINIGGMNENCKDKTSSG